MHEEILFESQKRLLPLISTFSSAFGLIGGTAIALQLGHRRSIDFDLAAFGDFETDKIRRSIGEGFKIDAILTDEAGEYTPVINGVKVTFLTYPFKIDLTVNYGKIIRMPDLLTLASLKAYALGRRAKWKDYVDLYFIFKKYAFSEVIIKAKGIFGNDFNEKLFREELSYFSDIDYGEAVDFMPGFELKDDVIKRDLSELSLEQA